MAIISAGVIMNVIFAVVFASIAYGMGVEYAPCVIGGMLPGEAAWQAGLQPGDEILKINDKPVSGFSDLQKNVALGDIAGGVRMEIRRPGVPDPLTLVVQPERKKDALAPRIGAFQMATNQLFEKQAVHEGTPAAAAQPPLAPGDKIVAIGDVAIKSYSDLQAALLRTCQRDDRDYRRASQGRRRSKPRDHLRGPQSRPLDRPGNGDRPHHGGPGGLAGSGGGHQVGRSHSSRSTVSRPEIRSRCPNACASWRARRSSSHWIAAERPYR